MEPAGLAEARSDMRRQGVVDTVAAKPLHVLLARPAPTLVVNALESEPGFVANTLLMARSGAEITATIARLRDFGFRRVVVGVNDWTLDEAPEFAELCADEAIEVVSLSDEDAGSTELLGATLHKFLPASDGAARPLGGEPAPGTEGSVGIEVSIEAIYHAHRAIFLGRPMTTKLVQMAGDLEVAEVFEAPIGTPLTDLARAAGVTQEVSLAAVTGQARMQVDIDSDGAAVRPDAEEDVVEKTTDIVIVTDPELADLAPRGRAIELERLSPPESIRIPTVERALVPPWTYGGRPDLRARVRVEPGTKVRTGTALLEPHPDDPGVFCHASLDGVVRWIARDGSFELVRNR